MYIPFEKYFLSLIVKGDKVYFSEIQNKTSLSDKWKGLTRMIYSLKAKKKFKIQLEEIKPDWIYVRFYQNKISCSIVEVAHFLNKLVIQKISNYSLLCPCNIYYWYDKNERYELCTQKSKWNMLMM